MRTVIRCGTLFTATEEEARTNQTLCVEDGRIHFVGLTADAPPVTAEDEVLDYTSSFVMPGLIDAHVHLSYGNAKTEEDIDLFAPVEYRALRGLYSAQKVLRAGLNCPSHRLPILTISLHVSFRIPIYPCQTEPAPAPGVVTEATADPEGGAAVEGAAVEGSLPCGRQCGKCDSPGDAICA